MKPKKDKQLGFTGVSGWGGKRAGSGRPGLLGQVSHMKRPRISVRTPLHITLRLREGLPSLRNKNLFKEFKESVRRAKKQGLYVIHFSVQSNHIHLFCEAKDNNVVALAIRALAGRFAKHIRQYAFKNGGKRKGSVFNGRYHLHILRTSREVKNALEYVLLNLSKHQRFIEYIDSFSSGSAFKNWKRLLGERFSSLIKWDVEFFESEVNTELDEILSPSRSWLGQTGWLRACG
jgi:putative transposase